MPVVFFRSDFKFRNKSFIINLKECTFFEKKGLIWNTRYYFYNLKNPFPLRIKTEYLEPKVDSEFLNIQLENKVARDLNRLGDRGLLSLLTPRNIIIGLVGLFILWLVGSGNWRNIIN